MTMTETNAYDQNFLLSLRNEIVDLVSKDLTPLARRFHYSDEPLEQKIRWRPTVLLLGNYSSGKSTFINEYLGADIQRTGQAPTDDSFTVIAYDEDVNGVDIKDGKSLLSSDRYPFGGLKRFGNRLAAHFCLKKVSSEALKGFAIIDSPGMLDSVSERDRGYNYQEVIGELAEISDLIVVMFDPHKAGTIRETYESLRTTLPKATYEDRVLFVLNRVDECQNLQDLLRVYGTLCWNLSQMTGRKDIPHIRMSWAESQGKNLDFLQLLVNQRRELQQEIAKAPKYRLDHMVTFLEEHVSRLTTMLRGLAEFERRRRRILWRSLVASFVCGLVLFGLTWYGSLFLSIDIPEPIRLSLAGAVSALMMGLGFWLSKLVSLKANYRRALANTDGLVSLKNDLEKDTWRQVKPVLESFLREHDFNLKLPKLQSDLRSLVKLREHKIPEYRRALDEL